MELVIKSLRGSCVLNVENNTTVLRLKELLREKQQGLALPEQQRLVFKHVQLANEAQLQQAGIQDGDQLVLLEAKPLLKPQAPNITPAPDAADIRAAITEEARRRGIEHTLKEERAAAQQRRNLALPRQLLGSLGGVDDHLVQLLEQALDGQFSLANLHLSGSGDGAEQADEEEAEGGEQGIQAPEPQAANVAQLTDMGFAEALARKALILTRDNVQVAVEWLFEHGDDPNAAEPPTQEQLRLVYGRRRGRRRQGTATAAATAAEGAAGNSSNDAVAAAAVPAAPPAPVEVVLSQLTEMGFDAAAAQQALAHVGPHLDLAVGVLLGQGLSAPVARERGDNTDSSSVPGRPQSSSRGAQSSEAGDHETISGAAARATEDGDDAAGDDGADFDTADEDGEEEREGSDYDDEEEDEYLDYEDEDDDQDLPLHLEQALGTMGSMDLDGLGSADMEQLLQGVAIQELYGSHLLMAGGIEGGMGGGPQGSLLRLMEAPGLLQQMVTALQEPDDQQVPQEQQPAAEETSASEGDQGQGHSESAGSRGAAGQN